MRYFLLITLLTIAVVTEIKAQEFAVSAIPKELLANANAVVRLEEQRFEVTSEKQSVLTNRLVITVLNENGNEFAQLVEYYDKLRTISDVDGYLYNAAGKQIKKMKKKDMEDLSGVADISLMDDNRIKRHSFYYRDYPYTVEYKVVTENKANLFFPMWSPQFTDKIAVEKSRMEMVSPEDYTVRYKAFNYTGEPAERIEKKKKILTWEVSNIPAIVREPFSPLWHELSTMVIFGPSAFQMESYKGNMMTWQDFGKFVHTLKEGKDKLPAATQQKVNEITAPLTDKKAKVEALYKYMQSHTRYISIQLGIGGWQPFDATYVATKGYGDCKALTNYMYSLLKQAGINSYYALVRAGANKNYITDDFPAQQFNHVILCVPAGKDTIWLECTSQTAKAGYLGDFTSDRYVLLVDEKGGQLVRTPKYGVNENLQRRSLQAVLSDQGTLELKAATQYTGLQQDDLHMLINNLSKNKVKEHLHGQLDFATYDVNKFEYKERDGTPPFIDEVLDVTVSNYATTTGKRIFLTPNIMTRSYRKLARDDKRKNDIVLLMEYRDTDSVIIDLPKGLTQEALPQDVAYTSQFGTYKASILIKNDQLHYYRSMEQYSGRFPAKDYDAFVNFYEAIYKADRARVVFVREEPAKKAF